MSCSFPLLLYKVPFFGSIDNTGICQARSPPALIPWVAMSLAGYTGLNLMWIGPLAIIASHTVFFFFFLITQYTSYQGNLILYLICRRKPRRLVRDI